MDGSSRVGRELLASLGLSDVQMERFWSRCPVVYAIPTGSKPGVGLIRLVANKIRHGIVEIDDPGNGFRAFVRFRDRTWDLARQLGLDEVEIFGAAVINPKLKALLTRQGFELDAETVPDDLDDELKAELSQDGRMEILTRTFAVAPRRLAARV